MSSNGNVEASAVQKDRAEQAVRLSLRIPMKLGITIIEEFRQTGLAQVPNYIQHTLMFEYTIMILKSNGDSSGCEGDASLSFLLCNTLVSVCSNTYSASSRDDRPYCSKCERFFSTQHGFNQHLAKHSAHNYCFTCKRDFKAPQDLAKHLNSPAHTPRTLKCPMCAETRFKTVSAICMHVESGGCPNVKLSRSQLANIIRTWETRMNITNGITKKRIGWTENDVGSERPARAGEGCWNGRAFECYLCHREFQSLNGLNVHLNSPIHEQKEYICTTPGCPREFTSLSGLVLHIEAGCGGGVLGAPFSNALSGAGLRLLGN
ncbi:hypothetical protein HDV05_005300 [Chytridiales sp. JEL 0842]|nr:hypothetical protein HDV05_005300 [Chytridiales sp. JEL 0842]